MWRCLEFSPSLLPNTSQLQWFSSCEADSMISLWYCDMEALSQGSRMYRTPFSCIGCEKSAILIELMIYWYQILVDFWKIKIKNYHPPSVVQYTSICVAFQWLFFIDSSLEISWPKKKRSLEISSFYGIIASHFHLPELCFTQNISF